MYEINGQPPLLYQLCQVHKLSIREFADLFQISKSHAEDVLKHRSFPSLELAIRIARYWECTVEDLFGWRVDDDAMRRPLIIEKDGQVIRLRERREEHKALELATNGLASSG